MGYKSSARFSPMPGSARYGPMPANLQPYEGQEATNLRQVSGGRPVKVWLPELVCSNKLQPAIPAKKRPPYPEALTAARPALDPSQPVKKRVPSFSEGFLEGLLTQALGCASVMRADVVPAAPTAPVPR